MSAAPVLASAAKPVAQVAHVFRQQLEHALAALGTTSSVADVHEARKQLKRARAMLRLLRPAIGDTTYRRANEEVRDSARVLSDARDAAVLKSTLDDLIQRAGGSRKAPHLKNARAAILRRPDGAEDLDAAAMNRIVARLRQVRARSLRWRLAGARWFKLARGARATYKKGHKTFRRAHAAPNAGHLHDWRKQVKYGWHQIQILVPLAPHALAATAAQLHRLADDLGDDHDLAVLSERVRAVVADTGTRAAVRASIERRRKKLQSRAFALGKKLYGDPPHTFEKKLTRHWSRWARRMRKHARA